MDIKVKSEPSDIERHIKVEEELIINSDWLPTKFEDEENEYYQEFVDECNQNMFQENVHKYDSSYEGFTIEYLDEIEDYADDSDDDDYEESERDDASIENNSDEEGDSYLLELETEEELPTSSGSSESKVLYQLELNKWIADNYFTRECPVCNERFTTNYFIWRRHIISKHKDAIEESESNYHFCSDNCGVCKKCNREFIAQFSRYLHSAKHEDAAKLYYLCKICHFKFKPLNLQKHILEKHPEVVKEFKTSGSMRNVKCPLCFNTYIRHTDLSYHFMDKHPHEYKTKLRYNCHLCDHEPFSEEEFFLQHLIENHNLNSWKILNYRKVFDDKEYFACTKCNRLFFQNDTRKLLSHFLKHENKCRWSCKFCRKKFRFKTLPASHMCVRMVRYYEKHYNEGIDNKIHKNPVKAECKIKNLQEFENHIAHVCPFCNNVFGKMIKWQHHLRTDHEIDTLQGLEMKVIANDSNKLSCIICHTLVANSPEQLHAHRFQHLPYKPYKCLFCSKALNNFKIAVNHVLKRCKDDNVLVKKNDDPIYDSLSIIEMQCPLCKCGKIHDLKHYEDEHNSFEDFFIKNSDNSMICKICHKQYMRFEQNSCFVHLQHHFDEKTFKCRLCLRSYPTYRGASHHLFLAHNVKPLNKQSNTEKTARGSVFLIKSHVFNEFAEFISYACPECNEGMTTQEGWHAHISSQHNFFDESNLHIQEDDGSVKCPTCKMTLSTRTLQQQRHKLTHMPYRSFICNLCYVRCTTLGILYGHFRHIHFAQGKFKCPICPEVLQTGHSRTVHLKEVHPRNEWPVSMCLICYKIYANKFSLRAHMITHDADRFRYSCDVCGSKILELKDFNAHMNRHKIRGEIKEKMGDDISSQSTSKSSQSVDINDIEHLNKINKSEPLTEFAEFISYACPECNEGMTSKQNWHNHIATQHNFFDESNLYITEADGSLKCPTCNITLTGKLQQKRHKLTHMKYRPFVCNLCYVRCNILGALYDHFRRNHFAQGRFQCPICAEVLNTKHERTLHIKGKHPPNEWPESMCSICCKILKNTFELKTHMVNHDYDRIEYSCDVCDSKILDLKDFKVHMDGHKIRGEINEKMGEDITPPPTSKNSQPSDIEMYPDYETEHIEKRKKSPYALNEFAEFISYVCPECNESMKTQQSWHTHIRTQHNFFDKSNLYITEADGSLKCPTCNITLSTTTLQQQRHKLAHMKYRSFMCNLCFARSNYLRTLFGHLRRRHFAPGTFECPICLEILQTEHKRTIHLKEIHPRNEWPDSMCLICYQILNHKSELNTHLATHEADRLNYTSCDVCGAKIVDLKDFNAHMNMHKISQEIEEKMDDDITLQSTSKSTQSNNANDVKHLKKRKKSSVRNEFAEFISYACPECNEGMQSKQIWHTHITTKHNIFDESNLYIKEDDGTLKCPTCNFTLSEKPIQQRGHKLTHMPYRPFMCNLCYVRSNFLGALYEHFRRNHFSQGTFECPICAEVFQTKHGRTVHLKEIHPHNEWPDNMCSICCKILKNRFELNTHMVHHNSDRIRYTCDICGSKIFDLKDFTAHMHVHKIRGEIIEQMADDITTQSASKSSPSDEFNDNEFIPEHSINKRKSLRKSSAPKKKQMYAE